MTMGYIAQGFSVANKTPNSVTLVKRKEFSILWAVIGFLVCLLPLLIYLIVYASESDQMVIISLAGTQPAGAASGYLTGAPSAYLGGAPSGALTPPRSPDGNYWWDGQQWRPISELSGVPSGQLGGAPSGALTPPRSPDGNYWWDGQQWRPISELGPMGQTGPIS
jgi:hypothetical protein